MFAFPGSLGPITGAFASCFSARLYQRFLLLVVGLILAPRRRCVTSALRVVHPFLDGHFTSYHRILSHAKWSMWRCGRVLAGLVLALIPGDRPVVLAVDDTVARHNGPKVFGRCCHRDPTRSSHGITVVTWGHRWVVLAVVTTLPFRSRPVALPVLAALYRSRAWCEEHHQRFRSWIEIARQLSATLMHWFPRRSFILLGDGGFCSHEMACFAARHADRLTLITRFYDDAVLRGKPVRKPKYGRGRGQPPKYGVKLPQPKQTVVCAKERLARANVNWYGGARRDVKLLSGVGGWHRTARPMPAVRWVYVKDVTGTHRAEYLMSTDVTMRPEQIVGLYTLRWPLETTFQEARLHLGLETPRQRCEKSVLRTTPLLLGLFTLVNLIYAKMKPGVWKRWMKWAWYEKPEPTFADALSAVRTALWQSFLLQTPGTPWGTTLKSKNGFLPIIQILSLAG